MNAVALIETIVIIVCVFELGIAFGVNVAGKRFVKDANAVAREAKKCMDSSKIVVQEAGKSVAANLVLQETMVSAMEDMAQTGSVCPYCSAFSSKESGNQNCERCSGAETGRPGFVSMFRRPAAEKEKLDCVLCGAENAVEVTREPASGHMSGVCKKCGARYQE